VVQITFIRDGSKSLQQSISCSNLVIWVDGTIQWPAWSDAIANPLGTSDGTSSGTTIQNALLIGSSSNSIENVAFCGAGILDGGATAANFPRTSILSTRTHARTHAHARVFMRCMKRVRGLQDSEYSFGSIPEHQRINS
jgi:hypothetical protein